MIDENKLEITAMISRRASFFLLSIFLILAFQIYCKSPVTYETHPVIWVDSYEFTFSAAEAGPNPSPQVMYIKNSGVQILEYTIADNAEWLEVSPSSGSSSGLSNEHIISVNKAGMAARETPYEATVTISSTKACNSPQQVRVSLRILTQPPAEISVSPRSLSFVTTGTNPPSQTIRIRNSGVGILNYTITDDANWLNVIPSSGSSSGNENSHTVSVNTSGLGTGTYNATITISDPNAGNSPQRVSVTLTIGASLPPTISVTPQDLNFSAIVGGSNPAPQKIDVRNIGDGTLSYTISDDSLWLSVSPGSGTSTGQKVSHTVSVDIGGLGVGTYNGQITISSPNASNSPQFVDVRLVISQAPTDNEIAISCSPTSGGTGTVDNFPITILGNTKEIKAFGLEVTYDSSMFDFVGVNRGTLTGIGTFTGVEVAPGRARIGWFVGDPSNAIPIGSSGSIAVLRLRVTCSGCSDGQQSQICIGNFTDDIVGMTPSPGCTTFTYRQ